MVHLVSKTQKQNTVAEPEEDLDVIHAELKNCLSRIQEETEASKRQLASLNIHVIPENLRQQLESIAEFQLTHQIDDIDDISTALCVSEMVLKKVKQATVQRELKKESRRLNDHKKQLNQCLKILKRDAKLYKEQQVAKEDTKACLQTKNLLLEPEMNELIERLQEVDFDENEINSSVDLIKTLRQKEIELDCQIKAETSYLQQFADLPPSLTEAARKIQEAEETIKELKMKARLHL